MNRTVGWAGMCVCVCVCICVCVLGQGVRVVLGYNKGQEGRITSWTWVCSSDLTANTAGDLMKGERSKAKRRQELPQKEHSRKG
jgi:hypothetical protein